MTLKPWRQRGRWEQVCIILGALWLLANVPIFFMYMLLAPDWLGRMQVLLAALVFLWLDVNGENDFRRVNPDGTRFRHASDDEVGEAAYCTWQTFFDGTCGTLGNPGPNVFVGSASFQANGVQSAQGQALCPFVITSSGEVTRLRDGKTIQVSPTLHLVPNPSGGCKLQRCEILKRGNDSNDE